MHAVLIRWRRAALAVVAALAAACGGGGEGAGGGGGNPPPAPPAVDVGGRWSVVESGTSTCAGEPTFTNRYDIAIVMSGSALQVSTPVGTFNGTLSGRTVAWRGSYPDGNGTTTITSLTATVASDDKTFSGSSTWSYASATENCTGSTQSFTGTRLSTGIPLAPSGLVVTPLSSTSLRLTWTDNAGNESAFQVERATASSGPFTVFGTAAANVATFDATGLAPSTTYWFRVRAIASTGQSGASNTASGTTASAALTAPAGLTATATSTSTVALQWTDTTTNETGFRVERAGAGGAFAEVGTVAANVRSFNDSGLTAGATYAYRVRAFDGAGASAYSNTASATLPGAASHTLTVQKSGTGSGLVSGSGLTCGTICSAPVANGTAVTLTAQPAAGSTFEGWTGCDAASGTTCTATVTANRTVVASFGTALSGSFTSVTLPATSSTGTYALAWTWSGLASTTWTVQEARDTAFANPTLLTLTNAVAPYSMSFTNRADGTWCYRIVAPLGGGFSPTRCITVARPTTAVLTIANKSRYDMIDIRLNGVQYAQYPNGIATGSSASFTFPSGGAVTYQLGVGFYDASQARDVWFSYSGSVTVVAGQTLTLTAPAITIGQLLAGFGAARNWDGQYFDANLAPHVARFIFTSGASWTLQNDFNTVGTGVATLESWPDRSPIVSFKLCATCETIQLAYPFGQFKYRNGPASWPIIEYVGQ